MSQIVRPFEAETVLSVVYPTEQIFVVSAEFPDESPSVIVECLVPATQDYTLKPIPYVTAENYVRCLSQSAYLLAEHVLRTGSIPLDTTVEDFFTAARAYELYYRNLAMTFHARVERGTPFTLLLQITNAKLLRRLAHDLILFTFANQRTVISGEMSFVYSPRS